MRYAAAITVLAVAASLLIPSLAQSQLSLPPVYVGYTVGNPWVAPFGTGTLGGFPYCSGTTPIGMPVGLTDYCTVMANVAPNFDYIVMPIRWPIGYNSDGGFDTGFENLGTPSSNPPGSGQYSFTNLDQQVFLPLSTFTCGANLGRPHSCWFALQLGPTQASDPHIPQTPDYVYGYGTGTWADMAAFPWTAGTTYYTGQTVNFGGTYYTLKIDVVSCTPTGNVGPTSDGCMWTSSSHAPPLDVAACTSRPGTGLPANATANINSTTCAGGPTCIVPQLQTGVPAMWENPAYVSEINAWNALMAFIGTKAYAPNAKYARMGMVTDGTTFIICEESGGSGVLDTLVSSSGTASVRTAAMESLWAGSAKAFWGAGASSTKAAGITFDANFACNSTTCDTNLAASAASTGGFIGILGLQGSDITNWYAGNRVTNGWTTAFSAYSNIVAGFHMQQTQASDTTTCALSVTCIQYIYPFVSLFRQGHPIYLEIYAQDMRCAFDSTWVGAGCGAGVAPYQPWANAVGMLGRNLPAPSEFGLSRGQ